MLVAANGQVKTKNVRFDDGMVLSQVMTDQLAVALNDYIGGLCASEITLQLIIEMERFMGDYSPIISPVVKIIYEAMGELDEGELRVSGVDRLLEYPEFSDPDRMKEMLGAIEKKEDILRMVSTPEDGGINVVIGSESSVKVMDNSALVYKPIVKDGKTLGAIGVLGPARMDYAKVLATLEGLSGNIESLLGTEQDLSAEAKEDKA